MARTKYGKSFKKKSSSGKFRKGTLIRYKYVGGKKVGAVKAPSKRRSSKRRYR